MLTPNGCWCTVTRPNDGVGVVASAQSRFDGVDDAREVTPVEGGVTRTARKERVAGEDHGRVDQFEAGTTGGMTRRVDNPK